jgi:hypothetical protein
MAPESVDQVGRRAMAGKLTIRITQSAGEIHDLRYLYLWSAWLDGTLLGKGHAFKPEEAEAQAMDSVVDLVAPDQVECIDIVRVERSGSC